MSESPDPQANPHTGRSRSSTLSGAFGPITPNPSRGMQHHERRPSFLGSLLGLQLSTQSDVSSPSSSLPSATGDRLWSCSSSVSETDEDARTSTTPTTLASAAAADIKGASGAYDFSRAAPQSLSASVSALGGSWGRAATWMAEKAKDDVGCGVAPAAAEPFVVPTSPSSGTMPFATGTTLGRRMSTGPAFRRPFEMPSYASIRHDPEESLTPLSRVVSAPSTTERKEASSKAPPCADGGADRGRTWWGSPKSKTKRKLSPMGERMIRDSMFH